MQQLLLRSREIAGLPYLGRERESTEQPVPASGYDLLSDLDCDIDI